jgi:hypothetical protein
MKIKDIADTHLQIMRIIGKLNECDKIVLDDEGKKRILELCDRLKQYADEEERYYQTKFRHIGDVQRDFPKGEVRPCETAKEVLDMTENDNRQLHGKILQAVAALREYDKQKRWDEDMQEEVRVLLCNLERCVEQERVYYTMYRKIKLTDTTKS